MRKNILITGKPKSGKSTLLASIVEDTDPRVGFLTKEIRENGERVAFEIETHQKERILFCDTRFKTPYKISRYFVNLPNLEAILPKISTFKANDLLYIDEIGQMQLLSEPFKILALKYLDAPNTFIGTISYIFENDFTRMVKERDDIVLVEVSDDNREEKRSFAAQLVKKVEKARGCDA